MATRTELVEAIIERYRLSGRADKQMILDEFVAGDRPALRDNMWSSTVPKSGKRW